MSAILPVGDPCLPCPCPTRAAAATAGGASFKLRGATYLADKRKVPAAPPMFELVAVDLLQLEDHMHDIARFLPSVKCVVRWGSGRGWAGVA